MSYNSNINTQSKRVCVGVGVVDMRVWHSNTHTHTQVRVGQFILSPLALHLPHLHIGADSDPEYGRHEAIEEIC